MILRVLRVRLWAVVSEVCAVYSPGSGVEIGSGVYEMRRMSVLAVFIPRQSVS